MKADNKYKPNEIEAKWQEQWQSAKIYSPDIEAVSSPASPVTASQGGSTSGLPRRDGPFYNLMMFPYPSAEGLHVGNMYAFTGADVYGRFKRMQGSDVFEPIGLDGFGIHSENYALKIGRHPLEQSKIAEKNFYRQLRSIGNSFDMTRTVETYDPEYYKWTQWLFIQLFKAGLAYRKKAEVNWCPSDNTVIADEQVIDGKCERDGATVEKRKLEQWFFRITDYAQRLLDNIEGLDWAHKVKIAQTNWIGRSEGAEVEFEVEKPNTTRVVFAIINEKNELFIEKRKGGEFDGKWFVPGGKVEPGESILETARREIKEETGLDDLAYIGNIGYFDSTIGEEDMPVLLFKLKSTAPKIIEPEKVSETSWQSLDNPPEEYAHETFLKVFEAVNKYLEDNKTYSEKLKVFTTRPDTLYGATFMVVSPEHELVVQIEKGEVRSENVDEVKRYIAEAKAKTDDERTADDRVKTGVFSGLYAINPVNGKRIPVWVADYVLASYGTGAIMAVPAHDQRDFEFANKYNLEIIPVIQSKDTSSDNVKMIKASTGQGIIMGSDGWDGFHVPDDIGRVIDDLEARGIGKRKVNFHLRDWLISRQRYWGPPIPMIFCENCAQNSKGEVDDMPGWYAESDTNLPVRLPEVEDWKPKGESNASGEAKGPLASHPEFYEVKCPECGGDATRETDVSDTFLDSSWYFLRYPSVGSEKGEVRSVKLKQSEHTSQLPWDPEITGRWLPVDMYIGGAEHSVLHLLYSRFITMVLKDLGHIDFEEPFSKFYAHGLIIKDGAKMSKSKGNVVVPDEYIAKYGADSLRTYLMFLGPYSDGGDFSDSGIEGMFRFLKRIWKLLNNFESIDLNDEREKMMHITIKKVTEDMSSLRYNTAIASLMEWYNFLNSQVRGEKSELSKTEVENYLKLLAPFAPHMTEELWQELGYSVKGKGFSSIHKSNWPEFDPSIVVFDTVTVVVQVNGKRRGEIEVKSEPLEASLANGGKMEVRSEVEEMAKEVVKKHLEGNEIRKVIYVPGKIINFVI